MQVLVVFLCFICGGVFAETTVAPTKSPERTPSNVEQPIGYIPHAVFPYAETYPNPVGYDSYLGPSGPQYPDLEEQTSIVPTTPAIIQTSLRMFAKVGLFLLGGVALLFVGGIFMTAVCSLTPLCTITFAGFGGVNKETMRSYVTPEGLSAAASFVEDAIGKYERLQRAVGKN